MFFAYRFYIFCQSDLDKYHAISIFSSQAKFITSANYKDAVEERFIAKLCGYPICPNKLGKVRTFNQSLHFIFCSSRLFSLKVCSHSFCRFRLNSIKFLLRPIRCMTSQSARYAFLFEEYILFLCPNIVNTKGSLCFFLLSVTAVTSATKPPKSLNYKYRPRHFGTGSMRGMFAASNITTSWSLNVIIFYFFITDSPPVIKLLKRGDGYVFTVLAI